MRTEPTPSAAGRLRLLLAVVAFSLAALLGGTAWWWSTAQAGDAAALAAQHPELAPAVQAAQDAAAREQRQVLSWVGSALVLLLGVAATGVLRLSRAAAERRAAVPPTAARPVPDASLAGPRRDAPSGAQTARPAPAVADRKGEFGELLKAFHDMSGTLDGLAGQLRGSDRATPARAMPPAGMPDRRRPPRPAAEAALPAPSTAPSPVPATLQASPGAAAPAATSASTTALPTGADAVVSGATAAARRGGEVVKKVVHNMEDIAQASHEIAQLIGVVDSIAFQTNLLALNAAVESARAADQGRGYAVVASEVRSLAQRSALAAREIQALVGASKETVESSAALVAAAGTRMGAILATIQQVNRLMSKATDASAAESAGSPAGAGIGRMSAVIGQLDQITAQNAPLVEQSAAAAADIRAQAAQLAEAVHLFRSIDTHALGAAVQAEAAIRAAAEKRSAQGGGDAGRDGRPKDNGPAG